MLRSSSRGSPLVGALAESGVLSSKKFPTALYNHSRAKVAELADAPDLGSGG
jgi:hypothetical protein